MRKLTLLVMVGVALFVFGTTSPVSAKKKPLLRPVTTGIQIKGGSICMTWDSWCNKDECASPAKAQIKKRFKKRGRGWSKWRVESNRIPDEGEYCFRVGKRDRGRTWEFKIIFKKGNRKQASKWHSVDF